MRTITLLLAALVLAGCQAHMIEKHGESPRLTLSGLKQDQKGGVVRWLSNGLPAMKKARRADAEKQMRQYCGGGYVITDEGPRSKFGSKMPIPKAGLELDEYTYAAFECSAAPK